MLRLKLYIWNSVDDLTSNYHSGGGLVIIAADLESARKMEGCAGSALVADPDYAVDVAATEARVWVFPDAGCC